jgi:hypothetical protein
MKTLISVAFLNLAAIAFASSDQYVVVVTGDNLSVVSQSDSKIVITGTDIHTVVTNL